MSEISGLLLAAGSASRFGGNKLQAELSGKPLILHSAASLAPCDRIIAVVREDNEDLHSLLQTNGIDFVVNHQAERGIGNSLARCVKASAQSCGWCILPADMPFVARATTERIVMELRAGTKLCAPYYRGRRGHPVGFAGEFREPLMNLEGDVGARHLLMSEADGLVHIDTDDPGVLCDIDTPQDLLMCGWKMGHS